MARLLHFSILFYILSSVSLFQDPDNFVLVQNFPYLMCASSRHKLWDRHWDSVHVHVYIECGKKLLKLLWWPRATSFRHQPIQSSLIKPLTGVYFGIASSPFSIITFPLYSYACFEKRNRYKLAMAYVLIVNHESN